ncbi:cysteine desulfurase family protein [Effusibacillus lacus]|uniref:Cysteine desulfurase n=1 Tax=Effusibacillus lacus TaxID=1348429 RepID=A0A292YMR2_9BACL|nr:cysteine desulfurase family protein [Effusibacillus lacus]TCS69550.1 cysteine desulfurase [Effusibacillus lacus]GAX90043.1 cysteine desulfurase [Effusibacillus lacus]
MTREIYLDNSATTRPYREVLEEMTDALTRYYGNPSSLHRKGLEAEERVDRVREEIARTLGARSSEVIFTSGGTEANNLAILGAARRYRQRGNHIITSSIEHACVLDAMKHLEGEGFRITYLPVDETGRVRVEDVEKALSDETILVSIMYVNNETGAIQPIKKIGTLLSSRPKTIFHTDAVQAYGKIPIRVKDDKIDMLTVSAHKLHGPKGTGALYVREGIELIPLVFGGGQEKGLRSGTENVPGIAGFGAAVKTVFPFLETNRSKMEALRNRLAESLQTTIQDVHINTSVDHAAPHIVNVSFPGVKGEVLVHALEMEGVFVSTGSACSSREKIYSHVLKAMGLSQQRLEGAIRLSLSSDTTEQDIEHTVSALARIVGDLRLLTRR